MRLIEDYDCGVCSPSDEEIREAIRIAESKGCVVRLNWNIPYSGQYSRKVYPGDLFETIKDRLPKIYGV